MGFFSSAWKSIKKNPLEAATFGLISGPSLAKGLSGGSGKQPAPDRSPWNAQDLNKMMEQAWAEYNKGPTAPYAGDRVAPMNPYLQSAMQQLAGFGGNPLNQAAKNAAMQGAQGGAAVGQAASGYGQQINNAGQNLGSYINQLIQQGANPQGGNVGKVAGGTDPTSAINNAMNPGANPHLQAVVQSVGNNLTRNLNEGIMPRIDAGAVADNAYGGSRQGVAQALAARDTQRQIADTTGQLVYQDYAAGQDRALSAAGLSSQLQSQADQMRLAQQQLGLSGAGMSAGMYGDALDAMFKSSALAPMLQGMGQVDIDNLLRAGGMKQDHQQNQINAAMQKYYEQQNGGWDNLNKLGQFLLPAGGMSTSPVTQPPEPGLASKILGGLGAAGGAYGALGAMGMSNPITAPISIGLGLLSAFG